ncbi:MAG: hypothetical protein HYT82_02085, partial [Candidatus Harrisonbacteria bacterium]|nr:hypothetical protein [Candidatus Harrisonbacteria bacterium]
KGEWIDVCDACDIAWIVNADEPLIDGVCPKCGAGTRAFWNSSPATKRPAAHIVNVREYKEGYPPNSFMSDGLYCTKCDCAYMGVSSPHVSEEDAVAFREMRCPLNSRFGGKCGGALRKPIPGERFGLYVSAYRPPSIFARFSSGNGKNATS